MTIPATRQQKRSTSNNRRRHILAVVCWTVLPSSTTAWAPTTTTAHRRIRSRAATTTTTSSTTTTTRLHYLVESSLAVMEAASAEVAAAASSSSSSSSSLVANAIMTSLDSFWQGSPYTAAAIACGVKASAADLVAQKKAASDLEEEVLSMEVELQQQQPASFLPFSQAQQPQSQPHSSTNNNRRNGLQTQRRLFVVRFPLPGRVARIHLQSFVSRVVWDRPGYSHRLDESGL